MPKKMTQEEFIAHATRIHGTKYLYDKTVYTDAHSKVIITCPIHGDFTQKATNHTVQAHGCPICAGNTPYTVQQYIDTASIVHNDKYLYSKVTYTNMHDRITITCPIHGDFIQQAYVHIQGHGCPLCANLTTKEKLKGHPDLWSYRGWELAGTQSTEFIGYTLYVIECWNDTESFIKVGKTFTSLKRRYRGNIPYSWRVLHTIEGSADFISTKERELHNKFLEHSYTPLITFPGSMECYSTQILDFLHDFNERTTSDHQPCEQH